MYMYSVVCNVHVTYIVSVLSCQRVVKAAAPAVVSRLRVDKGAVIKVSPSVDTQKSMQLHYSLLSVQESITIGSITPDPCRLGLL